MTCREKLMSEHPNEYTNVFTKAGVTACPVHYNYLPTPNYCDCSVFRDIGGTKCHDCWNRDIEEENKLIYAHILSNEIGKVTDIKEENGGITATIEPIIKDSGDRTEFATGAVRDMREGKGRMDLLPWAAIMEVSKHCENGAKKYGEHNVDKGIPTNSLCDSAARHLAKYLEGWTDEPHLVAAAWNLLWAIQMEIKKPEVVNTPWNLRDGITTMKLE